MGLVLLHLRFKINAFFNWKYNKSGIIFSLLYLATTSYSLFIVHLLTGPLNSQISPASIKHIIFGTLILLTIIRKFIPQYIPFRKRLLQYHPKSAIFRHAFNILDEILCFNFLNAILFICLLLIFPFYHWKDACIWITWLCVAIISRRVVQCFFEQRILHYTRFLLGCLVPIATTIIMLLWQFNYELPQTALAVLVVILLVSFMMEEVVSEYDDTGKQGVTSEHLGINVLLNAPAVRVSVLAALILKSVFMILFTIKIQKKGPGDMLFIIMLLSSPAYLFTYCFNNSWGMLRNYWFTLDRANPSGFLIWRFQLRLIAVPLAIDCFITSIFYLANDKLGPVIIISYFFSVILLCVLAYYWSLLFPFYVSKGFSMSVNTSTVAAFCTIIICTAMYLATYSPIFYLIGGLYLIIAVALMKGMNKFYSDTRIGLYHKLFH
ncbi:MAG: hypothetical protein JO154_13975 [Chitinophaga sp.]|uniref:hypothetical protein n=1 Tax=Chitinophaga sp. TaxID=1869181 RepID=UPI0025C58501|nr:hypothetical protein [Chitinophaga sp.]MBV8253712.1 hypothetical protein [Chitinophaga sp.]